MVLFVFGIPVVVICFLTPDFTTSPVNEVPGLAMVEIDRKNTRFSVAKVVKVINVFVFIF
jgi:hypothetical protein